jgi:enoyl-CoA hydratase
MTTEPLVTEERDGILILTLNRPHVRNAIDASIARAIGAALDKFDADDRLAVAIFTGAGGCFSAGKDLGEPFGPGAGPVAGDRGFAGLVRKSSKKPLIAAVESFAVAGGFEITLACDLIVASRTAFFGLPEVKRGLVPAAGALLRLPRRIPYNLVMELALTGDFISAERLYNLGLVNRLVEPGAALEAAILLARRIMEGAPKARINIKRILTEQQDWTLENMWRNQDPYFQDSVNSADAKEGARAFKERRAPVWQGR